MVFLLLLGALDAATRGAFHLPALVPPFGASVAIVFFTPESPLGRPRNVLLGHTLSALAASLVLWALPNASPVLMACVAVPTAILLMVATRSFHPPGGATALLAVVSQPKLGFGMLLCPALLGGLLLVGVRGTLDALLQAYMRRRERLRAALDEAAHSLQAGELSLDD